MAKIKSTSDISLKLNLLLKTSQAVVVKYFNFELKMSGENWFCWTGECRMVGGGRLCVTSQNLHLSPGEDQAVADVRIISNEKCRPPQGEYIKRWILDTQPGLPTLLTFITVSR